MQYNNIQYNNIYDTQIVFYCDLVKNYNIILQKKPRKLT